jgi:hypothetical protein
MKAYQAIAEVNKSTTFCLKTLKMLILRKKIYIKAF